MEGKVGETFHYKGEIYQAVPSYDGCKGCAFDKGSICLAEPLNKLTESCVNVHNSLSVIFKKVKDMKIKNNQLTIDIPKGMKIDIENSDLEKGIIKFKKNSITLEDIYKNQGKNNTFVINVVINNKNTYNRILAIAQLMDIANYYNKGWKPNWSNERENKYYICYINGINDYVINCSNTTNNSFVYFKNMEDANTVMCNPEFRYILDAIYKN